MATYLITHEVDDVEHWWNSPKRAASKSLSKDTSPRLSNVTWLSNSGSLRDTPLWLRISASGVFS